MKKSVLFIAAITTIVLCALYSKQPGQTLVEEKTDVAQIESIATAESGTVNQQPTTKPDKILYHLEPRPRPLDPATCDKELMERVLWNIEHKYENSPGIPSVEDELRKERQKQTAQIGVPSLDEGKIDQVINEYLRQYGVRDTKPKHVTYHNGYPMLKYYLDNENGTFAFVAAMPTDYEEPYTYLYLGIAYTEDLKKEGSLFYDVGQDGKYGSEMFYDRQGKMVTEIFYQYSKSVPFPIITNYHNLEQVSGNFYGNPYLNTGQRFWLYDSALEFDENGRWSKYNGNIFSDGYGDSELEGYQTPVYDENGYLLEIVETLRGSRYQDNPEEWIQDGSISFTYSESGKLTQIDYGGFSGTHGSSGNTGTILYDEMERVVHVESFHSSGDYHYFYLYQDMEIYPFAIFEFGGMPYSSDDFDGYGMTYGMDFNAWILREQ